MDVRDRLAFRIPEAIQATGLKQTQLYEKMQLGELAYVKVGTSRLIMRADLEAFLERHRVTEAA